MMLKILFYPWSWYLLLLLHFIQCKLHLLTSKIVLLLSDDCKHNIQLSWGQKLNKGSFVHTHITQPAQMHISNTQKLLFYHKKKYICVYGAVNHFTNEETNKSSNITLKILSSCVPNWFFVVVVHVNFIHIVEQEGLSSYINCIKYRFQYATF